MDEELSKLFPDAQGAERPLECSECKRRIHVLYTEVVKGSITHTAMCQECPELQCRLYGTSMKEGAAAKGVGLGLGCGTCGTTLSAVRTGHLLGCSECYSVFADIIRQDLLVSRHLPQRFETAKAGIPLHIGRTPAVMQQANPTLKLLALNEALSETLKKEDYEQAAQLRDQIKKLTEQPDEQTKQ